MGRERGIAREIGVASSKASYYCTRCNKKLAKKVNDQAGERQRNGKFPWVGEGAIGPAGVGMDSRYLGLKVILTSRRFAG